MLFWLIILVIVLVLSFLLATRSMRNSVSKVKAPDHPQSLYLLRNPELIDAQLLQKLHQILIEEQATISFEKLLKGSEKALAIYGPQFLPSRLPELNLLELEDYLIPKDQTLTTKNALKVNADQAFVWTIPVQPGMSSPNLTDLNLAEDEQFFYQIILAPLTQKEQNLFQLTGRALVGTPNKLDKIKLAKRLFNEMNGKLGIESEKLLSSPNSFEKYQFRLPEGKVVFSLDQTLEIL